MGDPPTVESGRTMSSKDPIMKCFVTDGSDAQLTGKVVIFFKVSNSLFHFGRTRIKRGQSVSWEAWLQ